MQEEDTELAGKRARLLDREDSPEGDLLPEEISALHARLGYVRRGPRATARPRACRTDLMERGAIRYTLLLHASSRVQSANIMQDQVDKLAHDLAAHNKELHRQVVQLVRAEVRAMQDAIIGRIDELADRLAAQPAPQASSGPSNALPDVSGRATCRPPPNAPATYNNRTGNSGWRGSLRRWTSTRSSRSNFQSGNSRRPTRRSCGP